MFGIRYQKELLDLVPGQNPVIEWVSTAFNDSDELLGSYSYPLDLAATPKNNHLLGFANQLAMRTSRRDISVLVELFDMPWKQCTLSYEIEQGTYKAALKIDNGEFATRIKEVELPQVFVETLNGLFVDHKWELVGDDHDATIAAIQDAVTAPGVKPWTTYPFQNKNIFGSYSGEGEEEYAEPLFISTWPLKIASISEDTLKETWYSFSFYLVWVLQKVCESLGYTATGNFIEDPFIQSLVIDNNSIYEMENVFHPDGFKLGPARHLPKITLAEFFKRLRNSFKLMYYFDSDTKKASFYFSDTVISSPVRISLDGYLERGFRTTRQPINGFEIIQAIDGNDNKFKLLSYIKSYSIGTGTEKQKIELQIGTCFMETMQNEWWSPFEDWRIPIKDQLGNAYTDRATGSEAHNPEGFGRNPFEFRLLSFRGMQPDAGADTYPYATGDGFGSDGITEICQSLWLGGSNGILEYYHKNWYVFFLRTELVELSASLPNIILNRLSPIKKIRFQTDEGIHLEAFMDKLQFSTDKDKVLLKTLLSVYPIYSQSAIDIAAYQDFNPGDVANPPGPTIYIRLVHEDLHITYRRRFLGAKTKQYEVVDVVAYFYSDIAGTIPMTVNGLKIDFVRHYRGKNVQNYQDIPQPQVTAYGTSIVLVNGMIRWYSWNSDFYTQSWTINPGTGYVVIT